MAEWSSTQLDHLEDALEDLEQEGALERWLEDDPDPDPALRERLEDYRSLLLASREALPLAEVPPGILDDVLAEAQRAAATPVPAPAKPSLWTRMRRSFLLPAVALAGTAALVFWIGQPDGVQRSEPGPTVTATAPPTDMEKPDAAASPVELREDRGDNGVRLGGEPVAGKSADVPPPPPASAPEPDPADEPAASPDDDAELEVDAKQQNVDRGLGGLSSLGDAPGGGSAPSRSQAPKGAAGPATGRWDIISRGDRARQAGDCVTARDEYAVALEDDEAEVRARAFAGMGLCDTQAGNDPSADANYERARELDGSIDAFLDSQAARKESKPRPKAKRKKAASPKPAVDQSADPFG